LPQWIAGIAVAIENPAVVFAGLVTAELCDECCDHSAIHIAGGDHLGQNEDDPIAVGLFCMGAGGVHPGGMLSHRVFEELLDGHAVVDIHHSQVR